MCVCGWEVAYRPWAACTEGTLAERTPDATLQISGPGNFLDRALAFYGSMLEEAWGWGFDVDAWRAHLGPLTWPEVLRQVAIISGAGPKRAKPQRAGAKPKLGVEGEDVLVSESGEVSLKIPARLGGGTMKAAAWLVRGAYGWGNDEGGGLAGERGIWVGAR